MRSLLQFIVLTTLSLSLAVAAAPAPESEPALVKRQDRQLPGFDVSSDNGNVDWGQTYYNGAQFTYIRATEGTSFADPNFNINYAIAANYLRRGAYHVAQPAHYPSSGVDQANFFMGHGGGWTNDGKTLPGAIQLGPRESGDCSGFTPEGMVTWIRDFSTTYREKTSRFPVIFTSAKWWTECTGNSNAFGANPLWLAGIKPSTTLPASWSRYTFWQYKTGSDPYPGNQDSFNGDSLQLSLFASGPFSN